MCLQARCSLYSVPFPAAWSACRQQLLLPQLVRLHCSVFMANVHASNCTWQQGKVVMVVVCVCTGAKRELFQYDGSLADVDPEIAGLIASEKKRQVCLDSTSSY